MTDIIERPGMGWFPDYPDYRDFNREQDIVAPKLKVLGQKDSIKAMLTKVGVGSPRKAAQTSIDLRQWCSPIENQGKLGSCTAHAGVGMVEYFEKKAFGKYIDASRLFLYKITRNLLHWEGDRGAFLRTTMQALVLFGIPPEEYWPYHVTDIDKEPSAFAYAFAQSYQAITYYRLDPFVTPKDLVLDHIKTYLENGLPSMFGFTVYESISQADTTGMIPFPSAGEKVIGGHAVVAVGYDNNIKIKGNTPAAVETTGAVLIRNSWGTQWGDGGYGWLPYDYVLNGLAIDWWSLLKNEWVDTGQFGLK